MSDNHRRALAATELAIAGAGTLDDLGYALVEVLSDFIPFDRFNIGLIDNRHYLFCDEFAFGHSVAGRHKGHQRTLDGSVVEAAIQAGDGTYYGSNDLHQWLQRFPRFEPVYNSGIRSMLAVPLSGGKEVSAALVFASRDANAYDKESLSIAAATGALVHAKLKLLGLLKA